MDKEINLRGIPCPMNYVRCRLEMEQLNHNQKLQVDLDRGEPEEMVLSGLKDQGYKIKIILQESDWIRFLVIANGR